MTTTFTEDAPVKTSDRTDIARRLDPIFNPDALADAAEPDKEIWRRFVCVETWVSGYEIEGLTSKGGAEEAMTVFAMFVPLAGGQTWQPGMPLPKRVYGAALPTCPTYDHFRDSPPRLRRGDIFRAVAHPASGKDVASTFCTVVGKLENEFLQPLSASSGAEKDIYGTGVHVSLQCIRLTDSVKPPGL